MPPKASTSGAPAAKKQKTAPGDKPKPVTQAALKKLSDVEKKIYEAALESGETLVFKALQEACDISDSKLFADSANSLLRKHLLTAQSLAGEYMLKAVPMAKAKATGALDTDVRTTLTVISDAGDQGIWKRTLKSKTGLPVKTLANCLKELEGRKMIKTVKGVKYPTRKLYMLYDLLPSTELTGGPWYTDERDLDLDFVEKVLEAVCSYIERETCVNGDMRNETMYPKAYWPYFPSLWHIRKHVVDNGITGGAAFEDEDYQNVLDILVADGRIEAIKIRRDQKDVWQNTGPPKPQSGQKSKKRKRAFDNDEDSDDIDEEDSEEEEDSGEETGPTPQTFADPSVPRAGPPGSDNYTVYRSAHIFTRSGEHLIPLGFGSGLLDSPCGVCPVRQNCDNSGRPRFRERPATLSRKEAKSPLALRIPGASDHGDGLGGDGVWRGGGTRGSTARGQINPEDCEYYHGWLSVSDNVPRPVQANEQAIIAGYKRNVYDW